MKKLLALLMAAVLTLAMGVVALAEEAAVTSVSDATGLTNAIPNTGSASIKLTADITQSITIPEGVTVTLDLNGQKLTNTANQHTITNNGNLTITGNGTVENTSGDVGAIFNYPGATANLNGGTFTGSSWYVIKNLGTMTINGATVTQNDAGSSNIANGYYNGNTRDNISGYDDYGTPTLTINSGIFSGGMNTVKNDDYGVLVINEGIFSNTTGPVIQNWHKATINDGTFEAANYVVANGALDGGADDGELTINGGTFIAGNGSGNSLLGYNSGCKNGAGKLAIDGGSFTGILSATSKYAIEVSSGEFSNEVPSALIVDGKLSVSIASSGATKYYIGTSAEAAIAGVEAGETITFIEVPSDNNSFELPEGVKVVNNSSGAITVNGTEIKNGENAEASHDLEYVPAKAPTSSRSGNIAYWYCRICNKYFADAEGTKELSYDDVVIAAIRDTVTIEIGGDKENDKVVIGDGKEENPNTGAPVSMGIAAVAAIAALGGAFLPKKK